MYHIEYSILNYYHSPISDECIHLGVLYHNMNTNEYNFKIISNLQKIQSFDNEIDIEFIKLYLKGIEDEIKSSIFNSEDLFDLRRYISFFANEIRFSSIKEIDISEEKDFMKYIHDFLF